MRYFAPGFTPRPSIAPHTSARQLELNARFVLTPNLKQKSPPILPGERKKTQYVKNHSLLGRPLKRRIAPLVRAARKQCHQHHQVRQGEQPLIRLNSGCFRSPRDKPKMTALREVVQVVHTNPREVGHFVIGEDFLTGFDGNHGLGPLSSPPYFSYPLDA
jgi:hypothetical protein